MNQTIEQVQVGLSSLQQGLVVGALVIGALLGCLAAGALTTGWGGV
ncbi:hypothetical protein [Streptomyces sp. NPDC054794]